MEYFPCFSSKNIWANWIWGNKINNAHASSLKLKHENEEIYSDSKLGMLWLRPRDKIWDGVSSCLRIYLLQVLVAIDGPEVALSRRRLHWRRETSSGDPPTPSPCKGSAVPLPSHPGGQQHLIHLAAAGTELADAGFDAGLDRGPTFLEDGSVAGRWRGARIAEIGDGEPEQSAAMASRRRARQRRAGGERVAKESSRDATVSDQDLDWELCREYCKDFSKYLPPCQLNPDGGSSKFVQKIHANKAEIFSLGPGLPCGAQTFANAHGTTSIWVIFFSSKLQTHINTL
jgi:hypothetical protein